MPLTSAIIRQKLLDTTGILTRPWVVFFETVVQAINDLTAKLFVQPVNPQPHKWIDSISEADGTPHLSQPSFQDISGIIDISQLPPAPPVTPAPSTIEIFDSGGPIGTEPGLNLIPGPLLDFLAVDNPGASRVDVTLSPKRVILYGTLVARPTAASVPDGTLYAATDYNNPVWMAQTALGVTAWKYVAGAAKMSQINVAAFGALLSAVNPSPDFGLRVEVVDYNHTLEWKNDGSGFQWGPPDIGSDYFQDFRAAPVGVGWHLCDGSVVKFLQSDGTLSGNITLPNWTTNPAYKKMGTAYSGPNNTAAVLPTLGAPNSVLSNIPGGGAGKAGTDTHIHVVSLPGDPIVNVTVLPYYRL